MSGLVKIVTETLFGRQVYIYIYLFTFTDTNIEILMQAHNNRFKYILSISTYLEYHGIPHI